MDSGIWVLGLLLIPVVCLVIIVILIVTLVDKKNGNENNKENSKKNNKAILIVLIIFLSLPIVNVIVTNITNLFSNFAYANVDNIEYKVEQVSDNLYDFYFFDKDGNYYDAQKQSYNGQSENSVFLKKVSNKERVGLEINLDNIRCKKVYMCDYSGHKVLVWNIDNYNLENSYE